MRGLLRIKLTEQHVYYINLFTEPIAPPPSPDKSGLSYDGNFPVYIGLGSGVFVVLCITCILCLCRSRNKERQKR